MGHSVGRRVLLYISDIAVLALITFLSSISWGSQTLSAVTQGEARSQMVCSLSSFFSLTSEDALSKNQERGPRTLDGRGILSCHSDQGFASEIPVRLTLTAEIPPSLAKQPEIAISGNTSNFVVTQEASQMEDNYIVRDGLRSPSSLSTTSPAEVILFRGERHGVTIEMKLTSQKAISGAALSDLKVSGLKVRFDDEAPDIL
jgi:hypothetical protein